MRGEAMNSTDGNRSDYLCCSFIVQYTEVHNRIITSLFSFFHPKIDLENPRGAFPINRIKTKDKRSQ